MAGTGASHQEGGTLRAGKRGFELLVTGVSVPIASFWLYTSLLDLADHDWGKERLLAVVLGIAAVLLLPRGVAGRDRLIFLALSVTAWVLFAGRMFEAGLSILEQGGPTIDVGKTTIAAIGIVREGGNPYTAPIDELGLGFNPGGTGFDYFGGFKYGPAMISFYMPAVVLFGDGGYFVMSFIALALAGMAAYWWSESREGEIAGYGCFCLVFTGLLGGEVFELGVNDLVPVALAMGAFALRTREMPILAGVLLGLSFAAKPPPALLLALPILLAAATARFRFALSATSVAIAFYVPWLIWSPRELIANLVVFNLERPVDSTAILFYLPEFMRIPVTALALAGIVAVPLIYMGRAVERGVAEVAVVACAAMAFFFAASPGLHRNYLVWFLPLLAVALGSRIWGRPSSLAG